MTVIKVIAFDEGESIPNFVLGVLCHTDRKNRDFFSVMGRRHQFSPPKIFAGAYARPETGMDFDLAFMTPRSQTLM